jgi:SAM-dependent methyltransferase
MSEEFLRLSHDHDWHVDNVASNNNGVWVVDRGRPESTFADKVHTGVAEIEAKSLWFEVRNRLIVDYLSAMGMPRSIWEVGSGTGIVARELALAGCTVVAVEPSISGAAAAARGGIPSIASSLESLNLPTRSLSTIGLFDVIEHLKEPQELLAECHRVIKPGGCLFLTVPALPKLWSYSDEVLGHYRRYTRNSLSREVEDSGFVVRDCSYRLWSLVLPVAIVRSLPYRLGVKGDQERVGRQLGHSSPALAWTLIRLDRAVGGLLPFGTSLFATAVPK